MTLFNRVLLLLVIFLCTVSSALVSPRVTDSLFTIGGVVKDVRNIRNSRNPNQYTPYNIQSEASQPGSFVENLLDGANIISALDKVKDCDPDVKGVCCVLPNFCVPVAECFSEKVTLSIIDILKSVPSCKCPKGYKGDGRRQGTGCDNVNECETGEAKCEQLCQDLSPGYACGCRVGYRLAKNGYGCEDVDECREGISRCLQRCTNLPGSFVCSCHPGYHLSEDERSCIDIDECLLMKEVVDAARQLTDDLADEGGGRNSVNRLLRPEASAAASTLKICDYPSLCVNVPGGYSCDCPKGYKVNPDDTSTCLDVDECTEGIRLDGTLSVQFPDHDGVKVAKATACKSTNDSIKTKSQVCTNFKGGFKCECAKGFKQVEIATQQQLRATDKLSDDKSATTTTSDDDVEEQNNRFTSFVEHALSLVCLDVNECLEKDHDPCTGREQQQSSPTLSIEEAGLDLASPMDPVCLNTIGSYECQCPRGYQFSPELRSCTDINECLDSSLHLCDENAGEVCINSVGLYFCKCGPGYRATSEEQSSPEGLVPIKCEDIDECEEDLHSCVHGCRNTIGSYECECPRGFTSDPSRKHQCVDIDECNLSSPLCPISHACINLPGRYVCACPVGYQSSWPYSTIFKTTQLTKASQRWLLRLNQTSQAIGSSSTSEEFRVTSVMIDWDDPEFSKPLAALQSEVDALSHCQLIDACNQLKSRGVSICPIGSSCVQQRDGTAFSCHCPKGSRLSTPSTSQNTLLIEDNPSVRQPERKTDNDGVATGRPKGILDEVISGGLHQLFSFGRKLLAEDEVDITRLSKQQQTSNEIRVDQVLKPDSLEIGMIVGLIRSAFSPVSSVLPLWIVSHLDWSEYLVTKREQNSSLKCIDINECLEGIDGNGNLTNVCSSGLPCCTNLLNAGFTCRSKKGVLLLPRSCPLDSIDLSQYF